MILVNAFTVAAPMDQVYDALNDGTLVAANLPGARRSGRLDERTVKGELRLVLGKTPIPYRGTLRLDEADREAGAMALTVEAREGRGQGTARAAVALRLRESRGSTTVSLRSELEVEGRAAKVEEETIGQVIQQLLDDFGRNLGAALDEQHGLGEPEAAWTSEAAEAHLAPRIRPPAEEREAAAAPAAYAAPVPGRVRVMTEEPLAYDDVAPTSSSLDAVRDELRRRPWLVPLLLLGGLAFLLLIRRRRD
jgi:carbon monoxide dehydrogenase subunit G